MWYVYLVLLSAFLYHAIYIELPQSVITTDHDSTVSHTQACSHSIRLYNLVRKITDTIQCIAAQRNQFREKCITQVLLKEQRSLPFLFYMIFRFSRRNRKSEGSWIGHVSPADCIKVYKCKYVNSYCMAYVTC